MVSLPTSIVYSKLKQRAYFCARITMSVINACCVCQGSVRSKNSVALFRTTAIQHKLTGRIVYLLESSSNKSIIFCRYTYHTKLSFPLYTELIADCCSDLGLSSGQSKPLEGLYERLWPGSFSLDDVCEKSSVALLLRYALSDLCW